MFYWYNISKKGDSIVPYSRFDKVTVYAMDKTIGAIEKKIKRQSEIWPDKYGPDDIYAVKKKRGVEFFVHGFYRMVDGKLKKISDHLTGVKTND